MPILVEWTEAGEGGKYTALVFDKVISDRALAQAQAWLNLHQPHGKVLIVEEICPKPKMPSLPVSS